MKIFGMPFHGFRIRTSFQYLNKSHTPLRLIVMLSALKVPHLIMSWLQAHDCSRTRFDHEARSTFFQLPDPAPRTPLSRRQAVLKLVAPRTSPVSIVLALGCQLLDSAAGIELWAAAMIF